MSLISTFIAWLCRYYVACDSNQMCFVLSVYGLQDNVVRTTILKTAQYFLIASVFEYENWIVELYGLWVELSIRVFRRVSGIIPRVGFSILESRVYINNLILIFMYGLFRVGRVIISFVNWVIFRQLYQWGMQECGSIIFVLKLLFFFLVITDDSGYIKSIFPVIYVLFV